ncbi:MAG: C40 family peptidase [Bacteroidota bacterium]
MILLSVASNILNVSANEPEPKPTTTYSIEYIDPEQQQLEWCFIYSNLLGFQIDYIANPRLFEQIGKWMEIRQSHNQDGESIIDCSGVVSHIYRHVYGKELKGNVKDIYKQIRSVRRDELREGDLLFFSSKTTRISEVGIFLGNNKFAHAGTESGLVISNLDDKQFADRYQDGGRP